MTDTPDPDKNKVLNLYALFAVTILLTLLPHGAAAAASLIMAVILLIVAFKMAPPKNVDQTTLAQNHAAYILRSIAGVTIIMIITMAVASFYVLQGIDYSAFDPCAQNFSAAGAEAMANASYAQVYQLAGPCMDDFFAANRTVLINGVIIAALLPLLYIGWRLVHGLSRALKGYRVANPRKWL